MLAILIPGLLLVALMIYASTRIKRVAAEAFEAEEIETDLLTVTKPEGFLNVINLKPGRLLEIYSKDFGTDGAESFRVARGEMSDSTRLSLAATIASIKESVLVKSELAEVIGGRKYYIIEAENTEKGIRFNNSYKVAEKDGDTFTFKIETLEKAGEEILRKVDVMLSSFTLK